MNPFISLLFFSVLFIQSFSHADIVHQTCKQCSLSSPNVNYTLCVESLTSTSTHGNHTTTLKALGVASTKITIANATYIVSEVGKMVKSYKPSSYIRSCLEDCRELYSDSILSLKDSVGAIKNGSYDDANIWISSAVDSPSTCEDEFKEGHIQSPLTKENDEFFGQVVISLCITSMLAGRNGL